MSEKHTEWKAIAWSGHAATTVVVDDASWFGGKRVIADCNSEEDAARIVACVNACAGYDTETIGDHSYDDQVRLKVQFRDDRDRLQAELDAIKQSTAIAATCNHVARMEQVEQQRDELLAVLKKIVAADDAAGANLVAIGLQVPQNVMALTEEARAAIARATWSAS